MDNSLLFAGVPAALVITGIVEGAKQVKLVDGAQSYILALALGLLAGVAAYFSISHAVLVADLEAGLLAGLAASGFYSGIKVVQGNTGSSSTPAPDPTPLRKSPDLTAPTVSPASVPPSIAATPDVTAATLPASDPKSDKAQNI